MPELGRYARELRARLWRPTVDEEVRDEIAAHLEMMERDLVARGLDPAAAREAARRKFGDAARIGDACRDIGARRDDERRRAEWLDEMRQDVRYALRQLRASPRFALVAILTLALGLGASTTIFGITDAVLLRPLPFRDPDRLVVGWALNPAGQSFSPSEPDYLDWVARSRRFAELATFAGRRANATGEAGPEQLAGSVVTPSIFRVLGVGPALGRAFTAEEGRPGRDSLVTVIGHALWQRRFAGDPNVLSRTIELDGLRFRIVGVMPDGFDFPYGSELWFPLAPSPTWPRGDRRLDQIVGRLAPGATTDDADRELSAIATQIGGEHPATNRGWGAQARPFREMYVSPALRARVVVLLVAVGLLLGMACVNVASLLLARAGARERSMAVRAALGAGRGRIVRQVLTESLVLSLLGAAAGVAAAAAAVPVVRAAGSAAIPRLDALRLDWRVLGFALAACVATGVVFGLAPALRLSRAGARGGRGARVAAGGGLHDLLRGGARVADAGGVRGVLIVASVALATVMLVGAALVGASFARLTRVDLGYRAEQVLTGSVALPADRYDPEKAIAFERELERRLAALPGVRAVGATNSAPFSGGNTAMGYAAAGREPANRAEMPVASWRIVTPGYFTALGVPLRRGRVFDESDVRGGTRVVVINETLARRAFPGVDPVGRSLAIGNGRTMPVVGVVGDTRLLSVDSAAAPTMYFAHRQSGWGSMWVTVRTTGDPEALSAAVRREVAALDPTLPVARLQPLARLVADATAEPRLTALVFGIFASAALTLAAVGLYGLVSYAVSQRTRELGVQLALGAAPGRLVRGVLAHGVRLAALGAALGAAAAWVGAGSLRAILYETSPTDLGTFAAVVALLLAVAAAASAAPARRAARLDPVRALRSE